MKRPRLQLVAWVGAYLFLVLAPLGLVLVGPLPEARSFWVELSVALGFLGLAMLALQFVLTARFRWIAPAFGIDNMLQFHRQAGLVAFGLVLAHPAILFLYDSAYLEYLDPRVMLPRAVALWIVTIALIVLVALTLWRRQLRIPYEWWRASHGVLALLVVLIGLAHVLRVGHYVSPGWKQAVWIGLTGAAMLLLVQARLVKPLRMLRRPYRVVEVRPERGDVWTLALEPVGHRGMAFDAGQFAWLTLAGSPFSLQQHPFSFSSSAADPKRLEITIKALGDFTSIIRDVPVGRRAYLEGPYGAFTLDPDEDGPAAFVVGGIGITPVISILRTLRDVGDRRRLTLIYGSRSWETVTFREELESLEEDLDLEVVHLLEEPPPGWAGESGLVDDNVLDRHLPEDERSTYFVCGPEPMMDIVERYLVRRGVPLSRIRSERFNIA